MARAHYTEYAPAQSFMDESIDRRSLLKRGAGALLAATLLSACGNESPASTNSVSAEGASSSTHTENVSGAVPGEADVGGVAFDLDSLPLDVMFDPEVRNPSYMRDVYDRCKNSEDKNFAEFTDLFSVETINDASGEFDVHATAGSFVEKLEMALNFGCDRESLRQHIISQEVGTYLDSDSYLSEMSGSEVSIMLVRALCGWREDVFEPQDVVNSEFYGQFVAAREANLSQFASNTQKVPGGNLNSVLQASFEKCDVLNSDESLHSVDVYFGLTNETTTDNPPIKEIDVDGYMNMSVRPNYKGTEIAMFKPRIQPTNLTPLQKMVEVA